MSTEDTAAQAPLIPSERVDELAQLIKQTSQTSLYKLRICEERTPTLTSTKLGGLPYWPRDLTYPTQKRKD